MHTRTSILTLPFTLALALAGCSGDDKSSAGDSGSTAASSSSTASTASTASTTEPATSSGTGTSASSTASTSSGSSSGTDSSASGSSSSSGSTSSTASTTDTSTSASTGDTSGTSSGTTGDVCAMMSESCAMGEKCCQGLECCAGVPVPPGKEFCSNNCPISDRNLKADFRAIDPAEVLARVVALPITTWRYKKDTPEIRHLGPMAQDFSAAFGLGDTDRMIFPLDATGVSMAAIQGLHTRLVAAEEENAALRRHLERLEARLGALEGGAR